MDYVATVDTYIGDDEDVTIGVLTYNPGDPGCTYGPPERCYPPEPPEVEWVLLGQDGQPMERELSDADTARIEEAIEEAMQSKAEEYADWED